MPKKAPNPQPEISIGLVGHVDHGKTTITQRFSGKWTDTHSEEIKKGITIRLGYANSSFYKYTKSNMTVPFGVEADLDGVKGELQRVVSFVDAPGHETLMATMLSGSAIMDAALLLVAADEDCPQPQTKEHLMALEIAGISNIIIVQNKIDLVSEEEAIDNYKQIQKFIKGSIAEKCPVIPISAIRNVNIDILIESIEENFKTPQRDPDSDPIMFTARTFDINKPGSSITDFKGGVLGGALRTGHLKIGDEIEIRPGRKVERDGRTKWVPILTKIKGIMSGLDSLEEVSPGGSIALLTGLDPSLVKSDSLSGNMVGLPGKLPEILYDLTLEPHLLKRVVGTAKELKVDPIKKGEMLLLNVNASATVGQVYELNKKYFKLKLKLPVCASLNDKVTVSRLLGHRFRLIGYGLIKG
jgi:translation initiation factor 2 subunit 3